MRRGYVCFLISIMTAGVANAQWQAGFAVHPSNLSESQTLVRADGTSWADGPTIRRKEPTVPAAISMKHYVHKPNKKALDHYAKAVKAVQDNQEGEALDRLSDAVRLDPEFFEAQLEIGAVWLRAEQPAEALPYLERALALDSASQSAQALAGWTLLKLGRLPEAELALRRTKQLGRTLPVIEELLNYIKTERGYASLNQPSIP
jgi:tetratricopeptide (TPR) repeat protein